MRPLTGDENARLDSFPGVDCLSPTDREFLQSVLAVIAKSHGAEPWRAFVSYATADEIEIVGACCFKGPPVSREVEIAYATLPSMEGKGFAKLMVDELVCIASRSQVVDRVIAHTLPEQNASAAVLRTRGFDFDGERIDPLDGLVWRWGLAIPRAEII